ncbi:hypothetical protein Mapa_008492 [Marchantia paleacea]|nr:hypothetical protein Mapa_008492 [Marchantia paleacea]
MNLPRDSSSLGITLACVWSDPVYESQAGHTSGHPLVSYVSGDKVASRQSIAEITYSPTLLPPRSKPRTRFFLPLLEPLPRAPESPPSTPGTGPTSPGDGIKS